MIEKIAWWNKVNWDFLYSKKWAVFINVMRIATFIGIIILIWVMTSNIEQVKLLGSDPCQICMNKTGASCFLPIK